MSILNFGTVRFDEGNDLPFILYLPTYTATAWFHKKLPADLQSGTLADAIAEAERFVRTEYPQALMEGDKLPNAKKQELARKVARLTGLWRITLAGPIRGLKSSDSAKNCCGTSGRPSAATTADTRAAISTPPANGRNTIPATPPFRCVTGTFNQYVRNELKVVNDMTYEVLTGKVQPWDYGNAKNRYVNVAPTLRSAMTKNHDLHLFVANGYYDLATPFAATDYTLAHMDVDGSLARTSRPPITKRVT